MNKYLLSILISITLSSAAADDTQCVSIEIPQFILIPDSTCAVTLSELVENALPDQEFLYNLGLPANQVCFSIIDPDTNESPEGSIQDIETGQYLDIIFSGHSGLTWNVFPPSLSVDSQPFTAASILSIFTIEGKKIGRLVTRDAGMITLPIFNVAGRLSIAKGNDKLRKTTGYIDEHGLEFDLTNPASASGIICGTELANKLFDQD